MPAANTVRLYFAVSPARYRRDTGQRAAAEAPLCLAYTVYLDDLTPAARQLAQFGVPPTDSDLGPGPVVFLRLRAVSVQAYLEQHCPPRPAPSAAARTATRWLASPPILRWHWPPLDNSAAPESYLNAQVAEMAQYGEIIPLRAAQPGEEWLPATKVAAELGVLPREVRRLCVVGLFPSAEKRDGKWYIPRRDLALPAVQHRPRGRPPLPRGAVQLGYDHPDDTAAWIASTLSEYDVQAWRACRSTATIDHIVQRFGPFRLLPAASAETPGVLPGSPPRTVTRAGPPWRVVWPG